MYMYTLKLKIEVLAGTGSLPSVTPRSKFLDISRQVRILKKMTTLLNLQNKFRQNLLSSSVD